MDPHDEVLTSSTHYREVLARRKPVLIAGILLSLLLGTLALFAGDFSVSSNEAATASVEVQPVTANRFGSNTRSTDLVSMPTEVEIATSSAVAERVIASLGLDDSADDLLEDLSVENPEGTLVLKFSVEHADQDDAMQQADAFALEYIAYRSETLARGIDESIAQLSADADQTRSELADAITERAGLDAAEAAQLDARIVQLNLRLADFEEQVASLRGILVDPGRVISDATVEDASSPPSWVTAIGLVGAGIAATIGVVVLIDRMDPKVREVSELREILPVRVFGAGKGSVASGRSGAEGSDRDGDEYRRLRLLLETNPNGVTNVLVSTPADDRAAEQVAVNLCRAAERADEMVVLVWGDELSSPALEGLGVKVDRDVEQMFARHEPIDSVLVTGEQNRCLAVLALPVGSTRSVTAAQLTDIYARLELRFNLVVTVAPSWSLVDTVELATVTDASVIAIDCQRATRNELSLMSASLADVDQPVVGMFVTRPRPWWK